MGLPVRKVVAPHTRFTWNIFFFCLWKYCWADLFPEDSKCTHRNPMSIKPSWLLPTSVFLNLRSYQCIYCIKEDIHLCTAPQCKVLISWRRQPMLHDLPVCVKLEVMSWHHCTCAATKLVLPYSFMLKPDF